MLVIDSPIALLATGAITALLIVFTGIRLSKVADILADRTGLGEALAGALMLGAVTSLSGLVTSVTAASRGLPELAISNAVGGIAAQTVFLVIADLSYRRANLEHAAASLENMMQGALLIACLSLALAAMSVPDIAIFSIHPASIAIVALYLGGLPLVRGAREVPGWRPRSTIETSMDEPDPDNEERPLRPLMIEFLALAALTAGSGYFLAAAADGAVARYGVSEALLGAFATAIVTSLPELVTTLAAVRRGALALAIGGIIGGNSFDTLFIVASDIAYREGPIYADIANSQQFLMTLTILMTAILVMGLLSRQRQGPGGIGFETILLIVAYLGGAAILALL
ncbi:cation antiporter (Na+/Ca2+) [Parvularcula bermudensis HTCC2503]|uniref:Cation antiporter (Na+/Ca2+) n=1 Tax=Parvularcula bermudensis (strain ATCC BAA-594 / HTCC2503 / KCTC 12087) TaxID=314260 RepID=E0TBM7_PARBH|nr:cation transporter [Parvularcula bermudensis]ADM08402.1 cation antiporter (Na+/Ca2+) [Parvularcula bermudensis HTCC2503]